MDYEEDSIRVRGVAGGGRCRILFLGNAPTAFGLPPGKSPEGWMLLTVPREGEVQFEFRELK